MSSEVKPRDELKFRCPKTGNIVTVGNNCTDCEYNMVCDTYACMLDEQKHY